MRPETARALAAINRAFYADHASDFSETRARPWAGWERLLPRLRALAEGSGRLRVLAERSGSLRVLAEGSGRLRVLAERSGSLRVLDVGCGNGRFARFLADALPGTPLGVRGVDESGPLLARARRDAPAGAAFERLDVGAHPDALPAGPFDLVALFGVIHGIPGRGRREALLRACADRVARGGLLVFTTWRVAHDPRLAARRVDWARYNARAATPVDARDLEPGDALLPWGEGDAVVRYFHEFSETELRAIAHALPLASEERFRADGPHGDGNEYLVFRAP